MFCKVDTFFYFLKMADVSFAAMIDVVQTIYYKDNK